MSTTISPLPLIVVVMLATYPGTSTGQSTPPAPLMPAPSPAVDCFTYLVNMSDCLTFVESGSNLSKPDPGCCPELTNTEPICLCQLLRNPAQVGISSIDIKRAFQLPSACNVTTPPVTFCAAVGVPVALPAPSEAPSAGDGITAANPPPRNEGNGGTISNLASHQLHSLIGLAVVLLVSC